MFGAEVPLFGLGEVNTETVRGERKYELGEIADMA